MSERYPDDATLLALNEDSVTGVKYIPTGSSPYFLEFRRLLQRTLLAAQRANDLRVYQDGDLTIGVRPGRCYVNGSSIDFVGAVGIPVTGGAITHLWLDSAGTAQSGTSGLPADRTVFVPLAEVTAGASTITAITDLRGEGFLQIPNLISMGVGATATEITQALAGVNSSVDATALNRLTAGPASTADSDHRHVQVFHDQDSNAFFTLVNNHSGTNAGITLAFSLPNKLADDTWLSPNVVNGFLTQRFNGTAYNLVGTVHVAFDHEGNVTTSQTGKLMGAVPIDGVVSDVILSVGTNIQSNTSTDGLIATVKANGTGLAVTNPQLTAGDGTGFRSTAQGDGTAAVIKSDGTQNVTQGDMFTVDLSRTAGGSVSVEAANAVVMVVIRANQPE